MEKTYHWYVMGGFCCGAQVAVLWVGYAHENHAVCFYYGMVRPVGGVRCIAEEAGYFSAAL
jgi:hypothetical protein